MDFNKEAVELISKFALSEAFLSDKTTVDGIAQALRKAYEAGEEESKDFKAGYAFGRHDATCGKLECEHITRPHDKE